MNSDSARDKRRAAERALLAALCQRSMPAKALEGIVQRLARHKFSTPEHEVIFEAASKLPEIGMDKRQEESGESANHLERQLMANLTMMGFPDVDMEPFFSAAAPTDASLSIFFRDL